MATHLLCSFSRLFFSVIAHYDVELWGLNYPFVALLENSQKFLLKQILALPGGGILGALWRGCGLAFSSEHVLAGIRVL